MSIAQQSKVNEWMDENINCMGNNLVPQGTAENFNYISL